MSNLEELINAIQTEAQSADFPLDVPVYESAKKRPHKTHSLLRKS